MSQEPRSEYLQGGKRYLLNSRHDTARQAYNEAGWCRRHLGCCARVVTLGKYSYVYLANRKNRRRANR